VNMSDTFVNITFPSSLRQSFTYRIKPDNDFPIFPGQRVVVPLRNAPKTGFIVESDVQAPDKIRIKDVIEIIDREPLIPAKLFLFLVKLSNYYLAPLGKTLSAAIPAEYQIQKKRRLYCTDTDPELLPAEYSGVYARVAKSGSILLSSLTHQYEKRFLREAVSGLKQSGFITESPVFTSPGRHQNREKTICLEPRFDLNASVTDSLQKRAPRQWEIIETLLKNKVIVPDGIQQFSPAALKQLVNKGIIAIAEIDKTEDDLWKDFHIKEKTIALNAEQERAYQIIAASIESNKFAPYLLQGVTGSGKTEVYLKLINHVLSMGGSALVLVPEITLTTHLAGRFRGEFKDKIAIWHSHLSRAQRSVLWQKIRNGAYPVIIGARSAILLPLDNLRLIIIDEEHDGSYKQREQEPRYHARDAALMRALDNHATVVMGSATPSLESLYNAATGKFSKIELKQRYSEALSAVIHVVDMKTEWKESGDYNAPFSRLLFEKIDEKLQKGEQVILLQNRRGYSNVVLCPDCGWIPRCRNCDITLTYHKSTGNMLCHYCSQIEAPPDKCPKCQSNKFLYPGFGTQKVEDLLNERFPDYNIVRMDLDTTRQQGFLQRVMRQFEKGEIHIILGTQMIAKGLDFPNVTLVGVLNADIGLFMPDFRARERVFQLLYQVAGRAGRGRIQGEVIIQTFNSEDPTIRCAVQQNFAKFTALELSDRNPINYPPFSRIASILVTDLNDDRAADVANQVCQYLRQKKQKMDVLGPAPAPLTKIKNRYRYIAIIKSRKDYDPNGSNLRRLLKLFVTSSTYQTLSRRAKINIEIDPLDLL